MKYAVLIAVVLAASAARAQPAKTVTLDDAIALALGHNHALAATRAQIEEARADEVTAGLRPNPALSGDVASLPLSRPQTGGYFDGVEYDVGLSWVLERGDKRTRRLDAARDATAVTRAQVGDAERALAFQVASQFIGVQLAESTLELSRKNLESFRQAVDIAQEQLDKGGMSENDFLKIKLQLLQFQTDVEQAQLARVQALSDLRQLLGRESVPSDFDVDGAFDYQALSVTLDDLERLARGHRPDLAAARGGVAAAESQHGVALAGAIQDVTLTGEYSRQGGVGTMLLGVSIPLAIFDRNQGERVKTSVAVTQAHEQLTEVDGQVMTDVADAYEALERSARVVEYYRSGYLDISQKSRDVSEYAYHRGATSLFDFLDAERQYRATQLGYRQALADYLTAIEQVRQSVGTRTLR